MQNNKLNNLIKDKKVFLFYIKKINEMFIKYNIKNVSFNILVSYLYENFI